LASGRTDSFPPLHRFRRRPLAPERRRAAWRPPPPPNCSRQLLARRCWI